MLVAGEGSPLANLDYELRDDGVLYSLPGNIKVRVQGNSCRKATVSLERDGAIVPPETGNLGGSTFRDKLTTLAGEHLGDINGFASELGNIAVTFDAHLKEREEAAADHDRQANVSEFIGTPYRISEDGGFLRVRHTKEGESYESLTNFLARVEEEIVRDDGAEEKRIYKISGWIGELYLPKIDVPVSQFHSLNWVSENWGLKAHIAAGKNTYAKEAIELYSRDSVERFRYAHTGWRLLPDGTRVYLHAKGAIS